ncbi:MAG: Gfo/Idh/MocA family oxidoreductase [Pirellulales bacterium]
MQPTRREFLKRSAVAGALASTPFVWSSRLARAQESGNRLKLAAIGVGGSRGAYSQGGAVARRAASFADMAAVCDVDQVHMDEFNAKFDGKLKQYSDYRELLEKERPEVVTIGTPDHWHVPISIAALKAGCDVYCEKPLTLTIEEGFRIRDAVKETGKVFQVGTQQRSEHKLLFLKAVALVRSGRLGKKVNAHVAIGGAPTGGPFPTTAPVEGLDWNMWVGPAQSADYSSERRKEFRWYYDYSGGKMTDWGAHHIDIAQWALGHDMTGPVKISGTGKFTPIVPDHFDWIAYLAGRSPLPNGFMTPSQFNINMEYADGSVINVCDTYDAGDGRTKFGNGILFVGDEGRIFVNRERLTGKLVEDMNDADQKWLSEQVVAAYGGKEPGDHMGNFFNCIQSREKPISDVYSHHRTMTSAHLCNIMLMLGRELHWDPDAEKFIGDEQATMLMSRPRREAYSWKATT